MRPPRRRIPRAEIATVAVAAIVATGWWMGTAAVSAAASRRSTWGQILILGAEKGGLHPSPSRVELYDPASGRFAAHAAQMDQDRTNATATVIPVGPNAGKVLVAGGWNIRGPLASTQLYDPATDRFTRGPDMSDERNNHTATVIASGPAHARFS
jgi:hypothetical protein